MKARARSFSRRSIAWTAGVAATSLVLAIVLSAFADDLSQPTSIGADSFSYSAIGHRGLYEAMRSAGWEVSQRRTERPAAADRSSLMIAAEPRVVDGDSGELPASLVQLVESAWFEEFPLLVVLPKWQAAPSDLYPRWAGEVATIRPEVAERLLDQLVQEFRFRYHDLDLTEEEQPASEESKAGIVTSGPRGERLDCTTRWKDDVRPELTNPRLIRGSAWLEPIVDCGSGLLIGCLTAEDGSCAIYVLSDPDVLNNHGLSNEENAGLLGAFFERELTTVRAVVIDETIHGFTRNSSFLAELLRFPLILGVGHGVLVTGLVVWAGVGRFGKPRPAAAALDSGKEALIDNTAKLLSVAGRAADSLPRYFRQTVRDVAAHYSLPADLADERLHARLSHIAAAREVGVSIGDVRDAILTLSGHRGEPTRVVRIAMQLHRWRSEMTHVD